MGLTTKFLVASTNIEQILKTLRSEEHLPEKIDKNYFENMGFGESTDFLVLALLIDLGMISKDGKPTQLFKEFRNKETSKEAFAYGIVQAYEDLMEENPAIYISSKEEIIDLIQEKIDANKSDIILNYMANTFKTLVNFVGPQTIEAVWKKREREIEHSHIESVINEAAHKYENGSSNGAPSHTDVAAVQSVEPSSGDEHDFENHDHTDDETLEASESDHENNGSDDDREQGITDTINFVGEWDEAEIDDKEKQTDTPEQSKQESTTIGEEKPESDPRGVESTHEGPAKTVLPQMSRQLSNIDKAFIKRAVLLQKLERNEEALAALDKVYTRYANSSNAALYMNASIALVNKMKTAEKLNLGEKVLAIYNRVIERLDNSDSEKFISPVDHAYIKKADLLLQREGNQEALDAVNATIQRFNKPKKDPETLARFMFQKAELLEKLDREEEALLAYEQYLNRFDMATNHE